MKTNRLLLVLLVTFCFTLSLISQNEAADAQKGLLKDQTITIDEQQRLYHLFIPENYANAPLVILLHGNSGSHNKLLGITRGRAPYSVWLDIAEREQIVLAVPNGVKGSNNKNGWNDCRADVKGNPTSDDIGFISHLIDTIVDDYKIDSSRVFAVGSSNGGHMAMRLAQEIPEKINAFAAIVAALPKNSKCTESNTPVSALYMNGTEDSLLPYNGGAMVKNRGEVFSAEASIAYWLQRNNLEVEPSVTNLPNIHSRDRSSVVKYKYLSVETGREVMLYKVVGGGHTEPTQRERYRNFVRRILGNQNGDIEMAEEVWNFFKTK